jgi:hypothetical protein
MHGDGAPGEQLMVCGVNLVGVAAAAIPGAKFCIEVDLLAFLIFAQKLLKTLTLRIKTRETLCLQ